MATQPCKAAIDKISERKGRDVSRSYDETVSSPLVNLNAVNFLKILSGEHTNGIPGQFRADLGTYLTAGTFVKNYLNGGIGILYFSCGTISMQSIGQKGTHTLHPVQLSSSTTAINLGFFFLTPNFSGNSGTVL